MENPIAPATALLDRALESGRIHSAYLISGAGDAPRDAAQRFARGLACRGDSAPPPCGDCGDCRRSGHAGEAVEIDGAGKSGPLFRHVGEHPDLLWVERGADDTRVRIGQIRAVQAALRLAANEGGWRAAVIADAEWLNQEAQNALLRLLEEPPPKTCLILVAASAAGLLTTIRSRCQRVKLPGIALGDLRGADVEEERRQLVARFDGLPQSGLPQLLDWAEEYRGDRAVSVLRLHDLLETGSLWLRERVHGSVERGEMPRRSELDAFRALGRCRKDLDQRNANPQMVAERALFAIRQAIAL